MSIAALAARLRNEARNTNERRVLVFAGEITATRECARKALEATDIDPGETSYVGPDEPNRLACEWVDPDHATQLLGTTRRAIVLDCHRACEPNVLGSLVGAVDGGGLFVLLTPPLSDWPERRDEFDNTLAVPPDELTAVDGQFRERLVETLRQHRGIAIVDADASTVVQDGSIDTEPRTPSPPPSPPSNATFPDTAYEHCLTQEQATTLEEFAQLRESDQALVVASNRGRGKSSVAGLASACLAQDGQDILVTAPQYRSARELFERARELLAARNKLRWVDSEQTPHCLETETGRIRFADPIDAVDLPGEPDRVIVDEAAGLPVRQLSALLAAPSVAYTTTIHGYEGAGRGFSVRFRDRLAQSRFTVTETEMETPIRYAAGDPIEVWSFRALGLDARPPVPPLVSGATIQSVTYRQLSTQELRKDEHLLREVFGLLVLAHYQTEPNDLARLLDAPNVSVHGLFHDGHVVTVALLAREGNLPAARRAQMYEGQRIRGNLIPDVLTSQLRDEDAGTTVGLRVLRIATHERARSRGLGSKLLEEIRKDTAVDWLGVGYGATPALVQFWESNGYRSVHLSTTRNDRSGEHSVIMLLPCSSPGEKLLTRHTETLCHRLPAMLTDSLAAVDPDIVRAVCRTIDTTPALELTDWEWRHTASVADGPSIFQLAPRPIRRLAYRHLVAPDKDVLTPSEERLLVARALQARPVEAVAQDCGFPSEAECMRTFGEVVGTLLDCYGDSKVTGERTRLQ